MKLGFLGHSLQDVEKAARLNFAGLELSVGALGDATKGELEAEKIELLRQLCADNNVELTALAYYRCATKPEDVKTAPQEYTRVFDAAAALGVNTITTMSGFDSNLDWKGNLSFFADRFGPVSEIAEKRGMRVAFENWMGFGGCLPFRPVNMGGCPDVWDAWFSMVPSKALGIEFDPSHLYWQGIDYIRALREYAGRVYHVHAKDTEMLPERRYRGGVNGNYFRFRIPGYGELNWPLFISSLDEIGYTGGVAIEHEDMVYWGERFDEGLIRGWQVLNPLIK